MPTEKSKKQQNRNILNFILLPKYATEHLNNFNKWYWIGGGIVLKNSSAIIRNNLIRKNDMAFLGGGIYLNNCHDVRIEHNIIDDNSVYSGYGVSNGGGIFMDSSFNISVVNNVIGHNDNNYGNGGGIYVRVCQQVNIINNIIYKNKTRGMGGGIYVVVCSDINIVGNLIYNNEAFGGGLGINYSEALVANNTICYNNTESPDSHAGGMYCNYSSPDIYNTIFYFNTPAGSEDQVCLGANADPNFYYSNIEGGIEAFRLADTVVYDGLYENNIDEDPQFNHMGEYPYSTEITSPCNNTGDPDTSGLFIPEVDLAANPRIVGNRIDMGAYENQLATHAGAVVPVVRLRLSPNPAKDKLQLCITDGLFREGSIVMTDIKGKNVLTEPLKSSVQDVDISALSSGVYVVKVLCGPCVFEEKVVVQ